MKRLKAWHLIILAIALPILYYSLPALGISLGGVLVVLMALACPLFHLLGMHGAHGHGHAEQGHAPSGPGQLAAPQADAAATDGKSGA